MINHTVAYEAINGLGMGCTFLYGPAGIDVKIHDKDYDRTKTVTIDAFEDDNNALERIIDAANGLVRQRRAKIVPVDPSVDIDRLSIGSRLYDLLTFKQIGDGTRINVLSAIGTRINLLSAIEYAKDTKTILIDENKLLETLRYANWPTQAEHIELVKRR